MHACHLRIKYHSVRLKKIQDSKLNLSVVMFLYVFISIAKYEHKC